MKLNYMLMVCLAWLLVVVRAYWDDSSDDYDDDSSWRSDG